MTKITTPRNISSSKIEEKTTTTTTKTLYTSTKEAFLTPPTEKSKLKSKKEESIQDFLGKRLIEIYDAKKFNQDEKHWRTEWGLNKYDSDSDSKIKTNTGNSVTLNIRQTEFLKACKDQIDKTDNYLNVDKPIFIRIKTSKTTTNNIDRNI